jgi:hypothetical protein
MFAMNGMLSSGLMDYSVAKTAYRMADEMLEARRVKEEPQGIVAIKKKRTAK